MTATPAARALLATAAATILALTASGCGGASGSASAPSASPTNDRFSPDWMGGKTLEQYIASLTLTPSDLQGFMPQTCKNVADKLGFKTVTVGADQLDQLKSNGGMRSLLDNLTDQLSLYENAVLANQNTKSDDTGHPALTAIECAWASTHVKDAPGYLPTDGAKGHSVLVDALAKVGTDPKELGDQPRHRFILAQGSLGNVIETGADRTTPQTPLADGSHWAQTTASFGFEGYVGYPTTKNPKANEVNIEQDTRMMSAEGLGVYLVPDHGAYDLLLGEPTGEIYYSTPLSTGS